MKVLHICNTFFESEVEQNTFKPLQSRFQSHPIVLQLQFLPLLYASEDDAIGVTDLPENPDPRLFLLDSPPAAQRIETWGPSLSIDRWAQDHKIPYHLPDWSLVREINSKAFSFTHSPKLPGASLLHNREEVDQWIRLTPGPKVLKTCYGTAGQGHYHIGQGPLPTHYPLIGEPWVERLFDFSTQWDQGQLLGATPFLNDPNGTYKSTLVSPFKSFSWALEKHLDIAQPLVQQIVNLGYSGNLGIDAFVYRFQNQTHLHPIVEINARKTMSWVALQVQKKHPEKALEFSFAQNNSGLLPQKIREKSFKRQISLVWSDFNSF